MNPSESVGVDAIKLVQVAFTYDVDNSEAFKRSSRYCCISATSSSINSTTANVYRPLSAFTKTSLFPIYDSIQSLFTIVFTRVGYSGTSASTNM